MSKVRNIIVLLLIAGALWHFYGETFNDSGVQGVVKEIGSDINKIKENEKLARTVKTINTEIQLLFGNLTEKNSEDKELTNQSVPKTPELDTPSSEQQFSVHNVELGDTRMDVEQQVGTPQRSSMNEYGVEWFTYHQNYHNFFMVAYNSQNTVAGLYTNQDLITNTHGISINSKKQSVLSELGEPLEAIKKGFVNYQIGDTDEYNMFHINNTYVTIFYDKHEDNTVTAVQIISDDLEQRREQYYAEPNEALKEGFEYQLFDLTNAARVNHGLSILNWDESVRGTARGHSKDMAVNNYFGHTNLKGQSPFDRMTEDNISYVMAGENLAAGLPSSIFAHEGLMNSIGHRESKLKSEFEYLAVGVAFGEDAQPYYTENFLTK